MAYVNRGTLHVEMKRYDKALADYDKAISIDPRYAMAYQNRGALHFNQKRDRLAISDWQRAMPLTPITARKKWLDTWIRKARSKVK